MNTNKLHPGDTFPDITVKNLDGESITLGKPSAGHDWQMVVIYRGQHCPLCTKYLNQLATFRQRLSENKVDLLAVSADSREQLQSYLHKLDINYPIAYGLSREQMQNLGVYISEPRSPQETDHHFAEPALFVVNEHGKLHVVDLSNNPFVRPELEALISGLEWIRDPENNYPIRGTFVE